MIYLSRDDVIFMIMTLQLTPDLRQVLESISEGGNILDDQADELRDCCTYHLDEVGFDEEYKLTEVGARLEALVDKLFIG